MRTPLKRRIKEQKDLAGPDIARAETAYLDAGWEDLVNIDEQESSSVTRLIPLIDDLVKLSICLFSRVSSRH